MLHVYYRLENPARESPQKYPAPYACENQCDGLAEIPVVRDGYGGFIKLHKPIRIVFNHGDRILRHRDYAGIGTRSYR